MAAPVPASWAELLQRLQVAHPTGSSQHTSMSQMEREGAGGVPDAEIRLWLTNAQTRPAALFPAEPEALAMHDPLTSKAAMRRCFLAMRAMPDRAEEAKHILTARVYLTNTLLSFLRYSASEHQKLGKDYMGMLADELPFMDKDKELRPIIGNVLTALTAGDTGLPFVLDLLPHALKALTQPRSQGDPDSSSRDEAAEHSEYAQEALQRACSAPWPPAHVPKIVGVLREVHINSAQTIAVLDKAVKEAARGELHAAPAVAYQMLLFAHRPARRGSASGSEPSIRARVLRSVVSLMDSLGDQERHQAPPNRQDTDNGGAVREALPGAVLRQVTSVVLHHIADAARYDHALVNEWLDSLEADAAAAGLGTGSDALGGMFQLSLLCTLCSPQQQQQQQQVAARVLSVLKGMLMHAYAAEDNQLSRRWSAITAAAAPASQSEPALSQAQPALLSGPKMEAALFRVVRSCTQGGSEVVIQGVMELAGTLMATLAGRGRAAGDSEAGEVTELVSLVRAEVARVRRERELRRRRQRGEACEAEEAEEERVRAREVAEEEAAGARVRCCLLGMRVLERVVAEHGAGACGEVLRRLGTALLGLSSGAGASAAAAATGPAAAVPAVLLLGLLARKHTALMLENPTQLKELLSILPSLPCEVARQGLLPALWPALRKNMQLQSMTVMMLRKVMFNRELQARLLAVGGYLHLCLDQLQAQGQLAGEAAGHAGPSRMTMTQAGCSQSALTQMNGMSGDHGVSLGSELSGILRRCLAQQPQVRKKLYSLLQGIMEADPGSVALVAELLAPHLDTYVSARGELSLDACIAMQGGEPRLAEPLAALLSCVQTLVAQAEAQAAQARAQPMEEGDEEDAAPGPCGAGAEEDVLGLDKEVKKLVLAYRALKANAASARWRDAGAFGFGDGSDWSPASEAGARRHLQAGCLLGCLEVLVDGEVQKASKSGWTDASRAWMESVWAVHCTVTEAAKNTKGPAKAKATGAKGTGAKNKKADKENGTPVASCDEAANSAPEGKPGPKPKLAPISSDYVKVEARRAELSASCLGLLCNQVAQQGASAASLGYLVLDRAFVTFVLHACSSHFRASDASHEGLAESLEGAFSSSSSGSGRGGMSTLAMSGSVFSACCAIVSGCSQRGEGASAAASSTQFDGPGPSTGAGPSAWRPAATPAAASKKGISGTTQGGGDRQTSTSYTQAGATGKPPKGKKASGGGDAKTSKEAEKEAERQAKEDDARVLLAVKLVKTVLGSARSAHQLAEILQHVPLPAASFSQANSPAPGQQQQQQRGGRQAGGGGAPADAGADLQGPLAVACPRLPHLRAMLKQLVATRHFDAAQILLESVLHVGRLLPLRLSGTLGDWVETVVCSQRDVDVEHEGLAKAAIAACCRLKAPPHDVEHLIRVATDVQKVVGAGGEPTQTQVEVMPLVTPLMAQLGVACPVIALLDELLGDMERVFSGSGPLGDPQTDDEDSAASTAERAALTRLGKLVTALELLVNTRFGEALPLQLLYKLSARAYTKVLLPVAKRATAAALAAGKEERKPSSELLALVNLVNQDLTPSLNMLLDQAHTVSVDAEDPDPADAKKQAAAAKKLKAAAKKDRQNFPAIIFGIEMWQKQLALLGKATDTNLLKNVHTFSNREFGITLVQQQGGTGQAGGKKGSDAGQGQAGGSGEGQEGARKKKAKKAPAPDVEDEEMEEAGRPLPVQAGKKRKSAAAEEEGSAGGRKKGKSSAAAAAKACPAAPAGYAVKREPDEMEAAQVGPVAAKKQRKQNPRVVESEDEEREEEQGGGEDQGEGEEQGGGEGEEDGGEGEEQLGRDDTQAPGLGEDDEGEDEGEDGEEEEEGEEDDA